MYTNKIKNIKCSFIIRITMSNKIKYCKYIKIIHNKIF